MVSTRDQMFMREALEEAQIALNNEEIPVGCVFVGKDGAVVGRGANKTNETRNGTQHAEVVAITEALSNGAPSDVFVDSELYVTCEPCIMCASALAKVGVKRVIFGCYNDRFGGNGSILSIQHDVNQFQHRAPYEICGGVLQEEAIGVFQRFYTSENRRGKYKRWDKILYFSTHLALLSHIIN